MKKTLDMVIPAICMSLMLTTIAINSLIVHASPALSLTVETNKRFYYLREKVNIYANLTLDGSPIQNELMALEVHDPFATMIYRTLQTGTTPITGEFEIVTIGTYKKVDPFTWIPTDTFEVGTEAWFNVTVKNVGTVPRDVTIAFTVYDGNDIPIGVAATQYYDVPPGGWREIGLRSILIPTWAYIGTATVYASAFTNFPSNGGVPYCSEESATFEIVRTGSSGGSGTGLGMKLTSNPTILESPQTDNNGPYNSTFRLSPEPWPGTYTVYASSSYEEEQATDSTTFEVLDAHFPPQASFIYSPPFPDFLRDIVTFDASGSTAEGYGDYITSYKWDFGDGTPIVIKTGPITTHNYTAATLYTVTLNVTDNEGLWCTTSKKIALKGPKAYFNYSPPEPAVNTIITFNASLSEPGYNGTIVPITSYFWDFGDGANATETDPITTHRYTWNDTFTVTLNVTDERGVWDTTSQNITILIPYGPKAIFTYSPPEPFINAVITFNASLSEPGWNVTTMPITSYFWDFGDGANATETDPITTHRYTWNDTFTVTLNVTDQQGLWNTTFQNITVVTPVGEIHDIVVIDVTISFPAVGLDTLNEAYRLWELDVNVKVKNNGTEFETFDVTASYKNITGTYTIGTQALANMAPLEETTITIKWNLANVEENYAGYTINATADIVPGEINITDNTYFGGPVKVKWLGDIDGDTHIYVLDLSLLGGSWRRSVGQPGYNPQADFDGDGTVYILDLSILGAHWREH